jgi:DNA modification methylase
MIWPADEAQRWPLERLVPSARNARTHSDAQVAQIAGSMREFGWTNAVLIDEEGGIIAGHGRVLAARLLGWAEAPVVIARGWSDAMKRAYALADNKLALNAGWDEALLRAELADLRAMGAGLELLGFAPGELAALFATREGLSDPDEAPAPEEHAVSRPGDTWVLGQHRLTCGDCTETAIVDAALAGARPHLMITDPPYGVQYDPSWRNRVTKGATKRTGKVLNDDRADWRQAWALFPGEVAYVWHGALHATTVAESLMASGFDLRAQIVWTKNSMVLGRGHYHWRHEPAWYAVRTGGTGHWRGGRSQTTVWEISGRQQDAATVHGTQKPVECMRRPMENNSAPGDAVYEPFSGSGTTIIAAETAGRACHAVELDPRYVDVAVRRWQAFTGGTAVLEADGRAFAAVGEERLGAVMPAARTGQQGAAVAAAAV